MKSRSDLLELECRSPSSVVLLRAGSITRDLGTGTSGTDLSRPSDEFHRLSPLPNRLHIGILNYILSITCHPSQTEISMLEDEMHKILP